MSLVNLTSHLLSSEKIRKNFLKGIKRHLGMHGNKDDALKIIVAGLERWLIS